MQNKQRTNLNALSVVFLMLTLCLFWPISASQAHTNSVRIWDDGTYRYIESNGIPDHAPGAFPNRGNPNTISEQQYHFRVPLKPRLTGRAQSYGHNDFGVALNGVPFDPGTAEFWNNDPSSGWNYEALSGKINLGLDRNHAHVQPTGAYHYHGLPTGMLSGKTGGETLVGFAADGFPVYVSSQAKSSYRVKKGTRPTGPGGRYDGTFVQDYEYAPGAGNLDECNGRSGVTAEYAEGIYHYYITDSFPFVPRCLMGTADSSFRKAHPHTAPGRGGVGQSREQGPMGGGMGRRGPPPEARAACSGRSDGSSCQFETPHGPLSGVCRDVPEGVRACVPGGR